MGVKFSIKRKILTQTIMTSFVMFTFSVVKYERRCFERNLTRDYLFVH